MGLIEGVVGTTAGWVADGEVVEVLYDPAVMSYAALVQLVAEDRCADRVFTRSVAQQEAAHGLFGENAIRTDEVVRVDDDTKYYLQQSPLRHLPMTELQAARANGLVTKRMPYELFSPRQRELLALIEAFPALVWPVVLGEGMKEAWAEADVTPSSCAGPRITSSR